MKKYLFNFILISIVLIIVCCKKNNNTSQVSSFDLVGTVWIAQDGVTKSGDEVIYYTYDEVVMLSNGNIGADIWQSNKLLSLSSITDLCISGCSWTKCNDSYTYSYAYPEVKVFDNDGTYIGKATIESSNKTATLTLADASKQPVVFYCQETKRNPQTDKWAGTKWEGGKDFVDSIILRKNNNLVQIYSSWPTSWGETLSFGTKYSYQNVDGENLPYFEILYVTPSGINKEGGNSYRFKYANIDIKGQILNIPDKGYKLILSINKKFKYDLFIDFVDKGIVMDTLDLYIDHNNTTIRSK